MVGGGEKVRTYVIDTDGGRKGMSVTGMMQWLGKDWTMIEWGRFTC